MVIFTTLSLNKHHIVTKSEIKKNGEGNKETLGIYNLQFSC